LSPLFRPDYFPAIEEHLQRSYERYHSGAELGRILAEADMHRVVLQHEETAPSLGVHQGT